MRRIIHSVLLAGCVQVSPMSSKAPLHQQRTEVVILGSGTPVADPDRSGPSIAIVVDDTAYLVDAGAGVIRRAAATKLLALKARNIKRVFFTHLHSDHTLGYPDLILSGAVLHRGSPLEAWGPHGLSDMTDHILAAWKKDIDVRVHGLEHGDAAAYGVVAHEIEPGVIYRDEKVKVTAFFVKHGSWDEAFGYRFESPDRTIVVSGDTTPTPAVIDACSGCDILLHEVYSKTGFDKLPAEDRAYHSAFHTSAPELVELASRAKPRMLVLYHQLFFGTTDEALLEEVKRGYSGTVVSARDLQRL
jgi:ribonuclease Z